MIAHEVNFDGLVGPTHNYAGLSYGNVASATHAFSTANPKAAAHQGLEKMRQLAGMGVKQAVLAPHERPDVATLRQIGFAGSDAEIIRAAGRGVPSILHACCSASAMWSANAATVSPSADTADGRVHFTPANLCNKFHRSIEHPTTARMLQAIFPDPQRFAHHATLPAGEHFSDEGAANHTRLCAGHGEPGVELFVFGRHAFAPGGPAPTRFPARQTFEASAAIARLHQLNWDRVVFAQQAPATIDAGVFHNDVIAVGHRNVLLYHARAFHEPERALNDIRAAYGDGELWPIELGDDQVTVAEAVGSYLFNSQLITLADGTMAIVVPTECQDNVRVRECLEGIVEQPNPLSRIVYVDVRESMKNGGGPACLRLRVVLTERELDRTNRGVLLTSDLYEKLTAWIDRHYRDRLTVDDLVDPALLSECRTALDELTVLLNLGGSVYPFQRT